MRKFTMRLRLRLVRTPTSVLQDHIFVTITPSCVGLKSAAKPCS